MNLAEISGDAGLQCGYFSPTLLRMQAYFAAASSVYIMFIGMRSPDIQGHLLESGDTFR